MNSLKELEKKYEELGKEIERLKRKEEDKVGYKDDPIFLLSIDEYKKLKDKIPQVRCWWWLRSPGCDSISVASVNYGGSISDTDLFNFDSLSVRPALNLRYAIEEHPWIGIASGRTNIMFEDNKLVFNGSTWIKLTDDIYIAEMPIDFRRFDEKSNDYETSEIRKFLLNWFEERLVLNWGVSNEKLI